MISGLYAGLLALFYVYLSIRVIKLRIKHQVGIGDGNVSELALAIRVHGNFAEYIPIAILLLIIAEIGGAPNVVVHGFGGLIVFSRLAHANGLSRSKGPTIARKLGTLAIFATLIALALFNFILYWR